MVRYNLALLTAVNLWTGKHPLRLSGPGGGLVPVMNGESAPLLPSPLPSISPNPFYDEQLFTCMAFLLTLTGGSMVKHSKLSDF